MALSAGNRVTLYFSMSTAEALKVIHHSHSQHPAWESTVKFLHASDIIALIHISFAWSETPEGSKYWNTILENLAYVENCGVFSHGI